MSWQPTAKPFSILVEAIATRRFGGLQAWLDQHPESVRERTPVPADQQVECDLPGSVSMLSHALLARSREAVDVLLAAAPPSEWPDIDTAKKLAERLAQSDQYAVKNPGSREAGLLLRGAPRGMTPRDAMMGSSAALAALCSASLREDSEAAKRVLGMRETDGDGVSGGAANMERGRRPHP